MNPFGIESVPADIVKGLQQLPAVATRLEEVAKSTSTLPTVTEDVGAIARAFERLNGDEDAHMQTIVAQLDAVARATDVLGTMDQRMATIEQAMPVLVEVQQHLAALPEAIESLDAGIKGLTQLLERLVGSMSTLDGDVASLQESIQPLGRLANKMPGSKRD